jgi:hypothetical protein
MGREQSGANVQAQRAQATLCAALDDVVEDVAPLDGAAVGENDDRAAKLQSFVAITGADEAIARNVLASAQWSLEDCLEAHFLLQRPGGETHPIYLPDPVEGAPAKWEASGPAAEATAGLFGGFGGDVRAGEAPPTPLVDGAGVDKEGTPGTETPK